MIQNLINNRLQLSSVKDKLYRLCRKEINNVKEFEKFVKSDWENIKQYDKHLIAQLLAGNAYGKGENINNFEQYIENIIQYEIR